VEGTRIVRVRERLRKTFSSKRLARNRGFHPGRIAAEGEAFVPAKSSALDARHVIVLVLLSFALFRVVGDGLAVRPTHEALDARWSMLAVGDGGKVHRPLARWFEGQLAVGDDLAVEDRVHPVDALVLLGDNFYPSGLREHEVAMRIRDNVVLPYCGFVALEGPRSEQVRGACPRANRASSARPLWAVLGNHDHATLESPALQQDVVPAYVSNWALSTDFVVTRESGAGVSLVLFDSTQFETGQPEQAALVRALRTARGPWRILVSHAPVVVDHEGGAPRAGSLRGDFEQWVRDAIATSGVRVHLHLAGDHHSLQLVEGAPGLGPALQVVAGSGSRRRPIRAAHPRRLFSTSRLGFARIDLVEAGATVQLVVSMFTSPTVPLLRFGGPRLAARFGVDQEGRIARVD